MQIHLDFFSAEVQHTDEDNAFEVQLTSSGRVVVVSRENTAVEARAAEGIVVATSCEQGGCGTCQTRVLEGVPNHRDLFLMPDE